MRTHNDAFESMKKGLIADGYKEKNVTVSAGKAMIFGLLSALPFVIILGLIYRFFLLERAYLSEINGTAFYVKFAAIMVISTVIHELLHGVGWALSSGQGWSVVRFNMNALMPSCACKVALNKKSYLIGVLLPLIVLGTGSIIFLFVYPGTISMLTMMVNFVSAGADLMIAFNVLKEKNVLIADHPTAAGYIAFYQ